MGVEKGLFGPRPFLLALDLLLLVEVFSEEDFLLPLCTVLSMSTCMCVWGGGGTHTLIKSAKCKGFGSIHFLITFLLGFAWDCHSGSHCSSAGDNQVKTFISHFEKAGGSAYLPWSELRAGQVTGQKGKFWEEGQIM